jgi:clan AA aspartic protease
MGAFSVSTGIAEANRQRFESVDALVDTGSTYTWIPSDLLERLGVEPSQQRLFELADGTQINFGMAWMLMRLEGLEQPTLVTFGAPGTSPLLGVVTLEEFGLGVDPIDQRLIAIPARLNGYRAP